MAGLFDSIIGTVRHLREKGRREASVRRDPTAAMMAQFHFGSIQVCLFTSLFGVKREPGNQPGERRAVIRSVIIKK